MRNFKNLLVDFLPVILVAALLILVWIFQTLRIGEVLQFAKENWAVCLVSYTLGVIFGKLRKKRKEQSYNDDDAA